MVDKRTHLFALIFATVSLLEMIGDTLSVRWLHYSCKPLIMILLLLYSWPRYRALDYPGYLRWLLIGMVFALVGDGLLMIQEVDLFAPGLAAFLVMQVCYSIAFRQSIRRRGRFSQPGSVGLKGIPFALYVGNFLFFLHPAFVQQPALTALWWPVVVYSSCLGTMGLMATLRQGLPGSGWVIGGALLFILSDSCIAIDKFLRPIAGSTWLIMSTYAAAQYLIVMGIMRQDALRRQAM